MRLGLPMDVLPSSPLLIFPCNGNGREALDCVADPATVIGFVDDDNEKHGRSISGHAVFDRSAFVERADTAVLAVPGSWLSYRSRRPLIEGLGLAQHRFATVIHPMASVSRWASVGKNVLIMAGVVITAGAHIGDHVCVLPNTVVHHDTVVGSWSLIGSGVVLAGGVRIGENCYVGSGASVMPNVRLGACCLVGLGSCVTRDVKAGALVAGNPARALSGA